MRRAFSFFFLGLAIVACSGGELAVGSSNQQQLQSRKDGKPTGDGNTCSWDGTAAYDTAVSSDGNTASTVKASYAIGESFKSLDGCNDCSCTAQGIMCTLRACSTPPSNGGTSPGNPGQACSTEAMICPDGTAVGRTGPNCEFEPCPAGPTVDSSKLGASCAGDPNGCPSGQSCFDFPQPTGRRCATDACAAVTCPAGQQCLILETFPAQIRCGK